jgi:hypothetical protein
MQDAHGERPTIAGLPGKPYDIAHHPRVGEQLAAHLDRAVRRGTWRSNPPCFDSAPSPFARGTSQLTLPVALVLRAVLGVVEEPRIVGRLT